MPINQISSIKLNQPSFTHNPHKNKEDQSSKLKWGVTAASALGVGTSYALIAKKQGFSINPKKIWNTPVKDWAVIKTFDKNLPDRKLIKLEEPQILSLAGGSVTGGLAAGAVLDDKKNFKAKAKEAVNQMLGNVFIPVMFVGSVSRFYDKYKKQILSHVPQMKSETKAAKFLNKAAKNIPSIALTAIGLGAGIITGNKVSNFINEKVYHKKVEREIRGTDFAPHVDDVGMAVTLMADKSKVSTIITNTVPLFLCVPGIETGTAKED